MAVENEIYFPNLVAENIDLQKMTSAKILERILNLEKAFVSEKSVTVAMKAVSVESRRSRCRHCGFPHDSEKCRFKDLTCNRCGKKGHLKRVCSEGRKEGPKDDKGPSKPGWYRDKNKVDSQSKRQSQFVKVLAEPGEPTSSEDEEGKLLSIRDQVHTVKAEEFNFKINGQSVPFEIDTGASVSTLSSHWVNLLQLEVEPASKTLKAYDHSVIQVLGKTDVSVSYNGSESDHSFYVVDAGNNNLCGKDLMGKVGIYLAGIDDSSRVNQIVEAQELLEMYCVDNTKPISSIVAKIHIKSDVTPKFMKARTVPFHYRKMVEEALEDLVRENVLEPVSCSEWAAPIVPVLKADKRSIRICGDFKELNKQIQCDRYPLPKIDELLAMVGNCKLFSKIDLKNAYLQVPVDEQSQDLLVINTPKGLFRYKRLPFGLSSSPGIFQKFISQLFTQMDGVAAYLDDIIICGKDKTEHDERLRKVLQILCDHNVKINKSKSVLYARSMDYLGYHISGEGIAPSPEKLRAIVEAPPPTSTAELHSFLGMITYYCKFVENFSSKLAPLYDLMKKGVQFRWTKVEEKAWMGIKKDLVNSTLLTNFDGESPLIVEVDASPTGVGCVLLQSKHGNMKPVYFASKKLSDAEKNYAQIDREGLALVFALQRFRYFLLGRHFVARTDHKPLIGLFGRGRPVPCNANARLQRWALLLSQYDYDLEYKAGKDNVVADALSRLPVEDELKTNTPEEYVKLVESLSYDDLSFSIIKKQTKRDPVLCQLVNCLRFGWSNDSKPVLVEYASVREDLSLFDDVIMYRNRALGPVDLRAKVLEHLHVGHNGTNAMKAEARNWVWWPRMDQDIEEITKCCDVCFKNFSATAKPVLSWPSADSPWSRLHIDYAGPVDNKYYLVIVDSFTKFLDVHVTSSITSASTIELLRRSFCNFGIPDMVVSDNAPNFVSEEMEQFCKNNGIKHVTPAPYNPASNGLAERAVQTLKEGLRNFSKGSLETRICRFLYNQRKTVHSTTGKSPAELMFNRRFKATIESVKQVPAKKKALVQIRDKVFCDESKLFKVGDAVFVRNYGKGDPWVKAEVIEVLGFRNYKVCIQDFGNIVWKRHADQIMHRYLISPGTEKAGPAVNHEISGRGSVSVGVHETVAGWCPEETGKQEEGDVNSSHDYCLQDQIQKEVMGSGNVSCSPVPATRRSGRIVKPPDRLNL